MLINNGRSDCSRKKHQIWANLGRICLNLGQIIFFRKSGFFTFFDFSTSLMQKIKEFLWTVSEKNSGQTNERTNERTNVGQSIGPTSKVGGFKKFYYQQMTNKEFLPCLVLLKLKTCSWSIHPIAHYLRIELVLYLGMNFIGDNSRTAVNNRYIG